MPFGPCYSGTESLHVLFQLAANVLAANWCIQTNVSCFSSGSLLLSLSPLCVLHFLLDFQAAGTVSHSPYPTPCHWHPCVANSLLRPASCGLVYPNWYALSMSYIGSMHVFSKGTSMSLNVCRPSFFKNCIFSYVVSTSCQHTGCQWVHPYECFLHFFRLVTERCSLLFDLLLSNARAVHPPLKPMRAEALVRPVPAGEYRQRQSCHCSATQAWCTLPRLHTIGTFSWCDCEVSTHCISIPYSWPIIVAALLASIFKVV